MSNQFVPQRGRPVSNKMDAIPAAPEAIAKAIFKAADKNLKSVKRKPS